MAQGCQSHALAPLLPHRGGGGLENDGLGVTPPPRVVVGYRYSVSFTILTPFCRSMKDSEGYFFVSPSWQRAGMHAWTTPQ